MSKTSNSIPNAAITDPPLQRPGPFGPAWALLPHGQRQLRVTRDTSAREALELMLEADFSQVPVVEGAGEELEVVGIFNYAGFCRASLDLADARRIDPLDHPVHEFMDKPIFIDRDTYIDTGTDWSTRDHVLVGTPRHVEGILSIVDAFGRLNDFAEAFVLIYEVETELRDVITNVAGTSLNEWLGQLPKPEKARPIQSLTDASFSHYGTLITNKERWTQFHPVFSRSRDLIVADLNAINDIRNVVFHFRRTVTTRDTDRLRRFRDKLRRGQRLIGLS